jgi:hypothetical protein
MSLRFWMVMLLAAAAVSCAHTDPPTESMVVAAATPRPSDCADSAQPAQDECSAKTMAGQRAPAHASYR